MSAQAVEEKRSRLNRSY